MSVAYLSHVVVLLSITEAVTTDQTGTAYRIDRTDNEVEESETWACSGSLTQSGGATSPTGTLYLEVSDNGTDWIRLPVSDAATDADETVYFHAAQGALYRYVRAKLIVGGATAPSLTGRMILGTSGDYAFTAVS